MKEDNSVRKKVDHTSALVFVSGMVFLFLIIDNHFLLYLGLGVGLLTTISPIANHYFSLAWLSLAKLLGKINGTILLGAVFYLLLFPISLVYRLFNKQKKIPEGSMFINRDHTFTSEELADPY